MLSKRRAKPFVPFKLWVLGIVGGVHQLVAVLLDFHLLTLLPKLMGRVPSQVVLVCTSSKHVPNCTLGSWSTPHRARFILNA